MITDPKIAGKLERIERTYADLRFRRIADVPCEVCETEQHLRHEPGPTAKVVWHDAQVGERWGGSGITAWFRGAVKLPAACDGKPVFVRADTGGESLFFVDGEPMGVFDDNHPVVRMTGRGEKGRACHLAFEAYAGQSFPGTQPMDAGHTVGDKSRTFGGVEIVLERENVTAFVFDLMVLRQLAASLDPNSLRKHKVLRALTEVFAIVDADPSRLEEKVWSKQLAEARKLMRSLLALANGPTTPTIGLIGASHIDTAWLWPLAETWRKCARTFSSALNLMDQYPEMTFLQPAPCHADVMRRDYPSLFKRMQRMAASGRWEPNGAMWVEPDCNIPSGESFVRQLLVGQTATRRMFGVTADTLWLPDVFGYSAALPQILKLAGVDFFCTTKMAWNDTTRFAYDTFHWQGIDGTRMVSHLNAHHSWPDPSSLIGQWNWVQHKDVQDRRLCAYGFGDGGGGPMAEMLEVARRVEDLEGCPRAPHTTLTSFMRGIRDESADLPVWVGELYLEAHRGTLTSISGIKRANRKSEVALRETEFLCTLASLHGATYPAPELLEAWKKLLTNQFHDILPGSSIAQVNDEALDDFEQCMAEAGAMATRALKTLAGRRPKGGASLLVFNSLSWDRTAEVTLPGAPEGTMPDVVDVRAQWVTDIGGEARLVVSGLALPALSGTVVALKPSRTKDRSRFRVHGDTLETPHAVVQFDAAGRIVSLKDKSSGREVVAPGGALNTFLLGEDVPQTWDNWDVDADQALKMRPEMRLAGREVVADGAVQFRVRSVHEIGHCSSITQDVVFHADSPQVDFETVVDWHEKRRMLKAAFDLHVHAEAARHEIQYGHVSRPTHANLPGDRARFEVCAHKWTDLAENGFGVALLNDCKYGLSVHGSTLGLTLIKSGVHPDNRGDEGRHELTYSLLPHSCGFSVEAVVRPAYELNVPVTVYAGDEGMKDVAAPLAIDAPNVILESLKWAETGKAFIARIYEAGGTGCTARVSLAAKAKAAAVTNLLEETIAPLAVRDGGVEIPMRPFEIVTIRFEL